ncbi:MAG: HAMP domain-containing histidine kinase [Actinomycetota bacterium]|nr:HAMP domain-containing histidine kinase [Actinomycetota bacterium]
MSLRARMGLAAGVAVALAVIAVAVSSYAGTRSELRGQIDNSLRTISSQALHPPGGPGRGATPGSPDGGGPTASGSGLGFVPSGSRGEPPGVGDEGLGIDRRPGPQFGGATGAVTLVYRNGKTNVVRGYKIPPDARLKALAASGKGRYLTDMHVRGTHIRVFAAGIGADGALAVALPLGEVDRTLSHELLLVLLIAAGGIALAALLGILVARTALAPIARFTHQTELIALRPDRIEHERLEVSGNDELARLGRTFNTTLDALERSVESQRNLVADASHELRTPISSIRANLQLMRDEALLSQEDRDALRTDMIEELDELTQLVGDVVELARGSKPSQEPGEVSVAAIVAAAVERARRRAPQLTFVASLEPTLVRGEGARIERAVSNLLDNAGKWSPPGGVVEIGLTGGTLTVRDHGPGFHAEDLPFVFDRFHRAKDARAKPGSGLGLAIVRQVADAHGGFVEAGNAPGGGALMRIGFGQPLAPEALPPETVSAT